MVDVDLLVITDALIAVVAFVAIVYAWRKTRAGLFKTLINLLMVVVFLHIFTQFYKLLVEFNPGLIDTVYQTTAINNTFISIVYILISYFLIKMGELARLRRTGKSVRDGVAEI